MENRKNPSLFSKIHPPKFSELDIFVPITHKKNGSGLCALVAKGTKTELCATIPASSEVLRWDSRTQTDGKPQTLLAERFEFVRVQRIDRAEFGRKIDLIPEWVVTQARSCPSRNICGLPRQTFSGSVSCSTGDDADCDPNTKPATPTWSCGKTRNCTSGPYWFPNCPSYVGYDGGYIYGSCVHDSCTGTNPKYCSAVTPTYTGTWQTGNWGSCSNSCGNGEQTRDVTCPSGNCDPNAKPPEKQNCSDNSGCVVNCPANPPSNASWLAGHGNTQPNCEWSCNATFEKSGNSCVCLANTVQVGNTCEPIVNCQ